MVMLDGDPFPRSHDFNSNQTHYTHLLHIHYTLITNKAFQAYGISRIG